MKFGVDSVSGVKSHLNGVSKNSSGDTFVESSAFGSYLGHTLDHTIFSADFAYHSLETLCC